MASAQIGIFTDPKLVETLMRNAFERPRTPRSEAYIQGAQWGLEYAVLGKRSPCPYEEATPEADAWFAGMSEGRDIWRIFKAGHPTILVRD